MEHVGAVGAQTLGGDHGGHDRTSAARLPDPPLQIPREVEVIVLSDGLQRLMVQALRLVVGVIVGEVGTGHDQGIGSRDQFGQRHAEGAAGLVALIAHDDRHQLELSDHALQERQLDLQSMLRVVRGRRMAQSRKPDQRAHLGEFCGEGPIDGDLAERGRVGGTVIHG